MLNFINIYCFATILNLLLCQVFRDNLKEIYYFDSDAVIIFNGTDSMYMGEFHYFRLIIRKPGTHGLPMRYASVVFTLRVC